MKFLPVKYLAPFVIVIAIISCSKTEDKSDSYDIIYQSINKEFVLIRNVPALHESNDEISNHIDSILSGLINTEFISTGQKDFDLDKDTISDIGFEIIDLNKFNPNELPDSFDSLAARVIPLSVEILDNSTYGYPDALNLNDQIFENGNWSNKKSVLGTFMNAGQFQGKGEKYLGIRFFKDYKYKYGWILLYCSQHNDTLRIIEYAYNNIAGSNIKAGQKE
ncbi:MAG: hypothetical protein JSV22_07975 [Bacteroidales bacterium]|nr:MAG: hypothetical protein JSV22_07975 [Bacteroidales bacterium]